MPDPAVLVAVFVLVILVESSSLVRLPVGLLLAVALLAFGSALWLVTLVGAAGVATARLGLARAARLGRERTSTSGPAASAQRDALRARLSDSAAYSRITFVLGALPVIPATFVFPLLGAMRAPLLPALAGTLFGRLPVLAATTALFTWLGRLAPGDDADAAVWLGAVALVLLVMRWIGLVDWEHRAQTGRFRFRDADAGAMRLTTIFGAGGAVPLAPLGRDQDATGADVIEGVLLGEEVADDLDDDSPDEPPHPPLGLPPTGLAPS